MAAANLANKQKKDLAKVDHSGVVYEAFRKSFYVEVPEIARMTPDEVKLYREVGESFINFLRARTYSIYFANIESTLQELEGIAVKGKNCPKPIKTWAQCGVSRKVLESLKKHNFEKPTPIQAQAIPAIMSGKWKF